MVHPRPTVGIHHTHSSCVLALGYVFFLSGIHSRQVTKPHITIQIRFSPSRFCAWGHCITVAERKVFEGDISLGSVTWQVLVSTGEHMLFLKAALLNISKSASENGWP